MAENIKDAHNHKKKEKGGKKKSRHNANAISGHQCQEHRDAPLTSSP
jgi:hypothetical protein